MRFVFRNVSYNRAEIMEWMLKRRFIIRAAQRPGGDNSRKWLYSKRERQWRRRARRRIAPLVWCRTLKPGPRGPESSSLASLDKIPKVMVARDDCLCIRWNVWQIESQTMKSQKQFWRFPSFLFPFLTFPVSITRFVFVCADLHHYLGKYVWELIWQSVSTPIWIWLLLL